MKSEKDSRLIAKLTTAFSAGASFVSFFISKSTFATSELSLRATTCSWAMLVMAAFFFGFGWLTEET